MSKLSGVLLPIAIGLASLQGCSTVDQRAEGIQAPAPAESITPIGVKAQAEISTPAPAPVAAPAPAAPAPEPAPAPAATPSLAVAPNPAPADTTTAAQPVGTKSTNQIGRYTVLPGDTLAGIAARQEVYGDARLWPFLYRSNVNQIGPRGLIFPNQILTVDRNHTADDVKALIARPKVASAPPAMTAKPVSEAPPAVTATTAASTAPTAVTTATTAAKPTTPTTAETPKASSTTGKSTKLSDYLNGAREAFAAGDTPWAIYYYSVYLGQKVNDAGAWGELGNVHYFDGNLMDAAQAFFNAANLFIDRGQTARALELMSAIEEGDPDLAEALHLRLTTVKK
jgi:hypothetical protein